MSNEIPNEQLLENMRIILQNLRNEIQTLKSENRTLKSENRTLRNENQTLKSENQTLQSENRTLQRKNWNLRNENQSLKTLMCKKDEKIAKLNERLMKKKSKKVRKICSKTNEEKIEEYINSSRKYTNECGDFPKKDDMVIVNHPTSKYHHRYGIIKRVTLKQVGIYFLDGGVQLPTTGPEEEPHSRIKKDYLRIIQ